MMQRPHQNQHQTRLALQLYIQVHCHIIPFLCTTNMPSSQILPLARQLYSYIHKECMHQFSGLVS